MTEKTRRFTDADFFQVAASCVAEDAAVLAPYSPEAEAVPEALVDSTVAALQLAARKAAMSREQRMFLKEALRGATVVRKTWKTETCMNDRAAFERAGVAVRFRYKNYKGEVADRLAVPVQVFYGTTSYHPEPQWFLKALDLEKGQDRDFALADVQQWYTDLSQAGETPEEGT